MTGNLIHFSTHCPVCHGEGSERLTFGRVLACGFCQGRKVVYAAEGQAAHVRREKARKLVADTMAAFRGMT